MQYAAFFTLLPLGVPPTKFSNSIISNSLVKFSIKNHPSH